MAYDALAESVELIRTRTATPVPGLSRRRRFAPMGVDVGPDFAVTSFARRGVGCIRYETYTLALRNGQWQVLGGAEVSADDALLSVRPDRLPEHLLPGGGGSRSIVLTDSGGTLDDRGRRNWLPWAGRWISNATVWVSSDVHTVVVAGRRLPVPWHGRVVVGWTGRRPLRVTALDRSDRGVATIELPASGR